MAGFARQSTWNDPRSVSDRQLLERLNRMALSNGQDAHDDPKVILTLSGGCLAGHAHDQARCLVCTPR